MGVELLFCTETYERVKFRWSVWTLTVCMTMTKIVSSQKTWQLKRVDRDFSFSFTVPLAFEWSAVTKILHNKNLPKSLLSRCRKDKCFILGSWNEMLSKLRVCNIHEIFRKLQINWPSVWRSQLEYSDWLRLTHLNMSTFWELTRTSNSHSIENWNTLTRIWKENTTYSTGKTSELITE